MPLSVLSELCTVIVLRPSSTVTNEVLCPTVVGVTVIAYEMSDSVHETEEVSSKAARVLVTLPDPIV